MIVLVLVLIIVFIHTIILVNAISNEYIVKHGLSQISAADSYSPEERKKRIEKFLEKRRNRVWTKKVKYDVRKVS